MSAVTLDYDPDRPGLVLQTGPLDTDLAKQADGLRHVGDNRWTGLPSWRTVLALRSLFGDDLLVTPRLNAWGAYMVQVEQWAEAMKRWVPGDELPWTAGLRPLQRTGVAWLLANERAIIADEPGSGKGVMTARAIGLLPENEFPVLIVSPKSVKHNHRKELERWASDVTPFVVTGDAPARKRTIKAAQEFEGKAVLIMNWEQVLSHSMLAPYGSTERTEKEKTPGELNGGWIETVLLDEAHRAQTPTSKSTRAAWAVAHDANRVWMTTATPAPSVIGYWSIMHTLIPWELPTRTKFQDRYTLATQVRAKGGRVIDKPTDFNPRTVHELNRLVDRYMMRRTLREIEPDLPPLSYKTMWVEMDPKQRKAYDDMRKKAIAEIDTGSGLLVATDPMMKAGRLLILASALPVLDDEGNITELSLPSSKVQGVLDWLEDNPTEQVVVFAQSRRLIELLSATLDKPKTKHEHVLITGAQNEGERDINVQRFQAGDARVIAGTYGAMSQGLTLTAARTQLMLQRAWEPLQNEQADGRTLRIGQEAERVTIIDVVSANSYDESVFLSGAYKEEAAQAVLRDPDWIKRELERF